MFLSRKPVTRILVSLSKYAHAQVKWNFQSLLFFTNWKKHFVCSPHPPPPLTVRATPLKWELKVSANIYTIRSENLQPLPLSIRPRNNVKFIYMFVPFSRPFFVSPSHFVPFKMAQSALRATHLDFAKSNRVHGQHVRLVQSFFPPAAVAKIPYTLYHCHVSLHFVALF